MGSHELIAVAADQDAPRVVANQPSDDLGVIHPRSEHPRPQPPDTTTPSYSSDASPPPLSPILSSVTRRLPCRRQE
jgi:hypothetical protein